MFELSGDGDVFAYGEVCFITFFTVWRGKIFPVRRNQEASVRFEYIKQMGDPSPGSDIGSQSQQDLFPDVDAFVIQLSYSLDW